MRDIPDMILIFLISYVGFIFAAWGSLEYHVGVFRPSEDHLRRFFSDLHFPVNLVFSEVPFLGLLTRTNMQQSVFKRLVGLTVPVLITFATLYRMIRYVNVPTLIGFYFVWLSLYFAQIVLCWRFGRRLRKDGEFSI